LPITECNPKALNSIVPLFCERFETITGIALCYFEPGGTVQELIHKLKYHNRQEIGRWFGDWCAKTLSDQALTFDWIIPVPLHPKKQRKRGYNQCEKFGKRIASHLGARYTEKILVRTVYQISQTRKNKSNRWTSTQGVFDVTDPSALSNCSVLLIDDVITTGATLKACCEVLRPIPGIRIHLAAIAIVP
jgi:ComF family protein